MTVHLRRWASDDAIECLNVFRRAVHEGAAEKYNAAQRNAWAPITPPTGPVFERLSDQWAWVGIDHDQIIGFMTMAKNGYLDMAYVLPDYMGAGVSGRLYDVLITDARDAGLTDLTVDASHLARQFFAKRGWRVDTPETVTRDGIKIERFKMSLSFAPEDLA